MSGDAACACGTCASCGGGAAVSRAAVGDARHFRQAAIRQRMMRSIAGTRIDHARPLAGLTTRAADDPAIALIDAHAASLHILAWYSARLAADGSILSGQDRDALARLTGLVGYVPRPALSATTTLAFTVDTMAGSPEKVRVAQGSKVASVPGQDEMPQIFETDAELTAVGAWNALRPHQERAPVTTETNMLCFEGVGSAAAIGDLVAAPLTATEEKGWRVGRIAAIEPVSDPSVDEAPFTRLHLTQLRTISGSLTEAQAYAGRVVILGQAASPFGATAPDIRAMTDEIKCAFGDIGASGDETAEERRRKCNPAAVTEWADFFVGTGRRKGTETQKLDLDAVYPGAVVGRVCILTPSKTVTIEKEPARETLMRIDDVEECARSDFLISAKVSRITLDKIELDPGAGESFARLVRSLAINIETEALRLYRPPVDTALPGTADRLEIDGAALLPVGRRVVLTGQRWMNEAGKEGEIVSEVATIAETTASNGRTMLRFERPVKMRFRSTTLRLLGNCIGASHGESPVQGAEIIGSGDAGRRNQRFALKGKPLSHVPAATARGYAPAIEARVDGRRWHHVATLAGRGSDDHAFTLRTDGEGASVLQFGGSLPSGLHNVTALYRTGAGRAGNLAAGRLTMAMAPVAGIARIGNPVLAEGGSDPEAIDALRHAAPQSVRTLDRVVSLSDHEAFAAAYRGVGKALATELYQGMRSFVCLTIATSDLASPAPDSDIVTGLADELKRATVPGRQVRIEGFDLIHPTIAIALATDPDLVRAHVETAARATLAERFGADRRPFGRGLHRSEILAAVQAVPGVEAAQIRTFTLGTGHPAESEGRLLCPAPSIDPDTGALLRAGLLALDPARIAFEELVL
jgi:predicted phage baseplate assembly protein